MSLLRKEYENMMFVCTWWQDEQRVVREGSESEMQLVQQ